MDQHSTAVMAAELRAARAILGWSQQELATHSGVSVPTINRYERADGRSRASTRALLKARLSDHGVSFSVSEDGILHIVVSASATSELVRRALGNEAITSRGKLGPRKQKRLVEGGGSI